jgi:peptidoglycan/xylan/chitin deacetylase (PgdA/CDA1 family)
MVRPFLALKVDVDTFRGTREGVPRLVSLLLELGVTATFLFSVGPDHTGRALRRVFRRAFMAKAVRTSVLSHYGLKTLLYGTLLPGPHIGRSCVRELRAVRDAGFEVGLHAYDHVEWQDFVTRRGPEWTRIEMRKGVETFADVFGVKPQVHGAAGWQMNDAAFELERRCGFAYASDTRGTTPFVPVAGGGRPGCLQIPTTLPTLDELIGVQDRRPADAQAYLLGLTRTNTQPLHVYTLHAELEGMKLIGVLRNLIEGWKAQGYDMGGLWHAREMLRDAPLPYHEVVMARVPGRSGYVATQGRLRARTCSPPALQHVGMALRRTPP